MAATTTTVTSVETKTRRVGGTAPTTVDNQNNIINDNNAKNEFSFLLDLFESKNDDDKNTNRLRRRMSFADRTSSAYQGDDDGAGNGKDDEDITYNNRGGDDYISNSISLLLSASATTTTTNNKNNPYAQQQQEQQQKAEEAARNATLLAKQASEQALYNYTSLAVLTNVTSFHPSQQEPLLNHGNTTLDGDNDGSLLSSWPSEPDQPEAWSLWVSICFTAGSIVLCTVTGVQVWTRHRQRRRRQEYQSIPSVESQHATSNSLIV
ncbi:hypothetical protein ACA910_017819 [Epithemia clementina (nom. ined.)]